jgi:subtilase family serine protease
VRRERLLNELREDPTPLFHLDAGDTLLETESHGRLDANETKSEDAKIAADLIAGLGDGFIFAVIDDEDEVQETNENNNVSGPIQVSVADDTDLVITSISSDDTSLSEGEDLEVTIGVGNQGFADAGGLTFYYYSADDIFGNGDEVLLKSDGHGTLDAGEFDDDEPVTLRYDALASNAAANGGSGYIFASIDDLNLIDEEDEGNNVSDALAFDIVQSNGTAADLRIADAWLDDATLEEDQNARIRLHVENIGDADANGETAFYWSADDTFDASDILLDRDGHGTVSAGELDTNERESLDYDQLASLGDGFIFAVIDADNLISESNETNNVSDAIYVDIL